MHSHTQPARVCLNLGTCETRSHFPEIDGDVQKPLRNAPAYWGLRFFPSLLIKTIYHDLIFFLLFMEIFFIVMLMLQLFFPFPKC